MEMNRNLETQIIINGFSGEYWYARVSESRSPKELAEMIEDTLIDRIHEQLGTSGVLVALIDASLNEVDWQDVGEALYAAAFMREPEVDDEP